MNRIVVLVPEERFAAFVAPRATPQARFLDGAPARLA